VPTWQTVPHLRASDRKCSAANSGAVNRRLDEAVAAGRAKLSATWKVSNAGERAAAVEDLAYEDCNLGCVQEHAEMKANERVRDEVKA